jgi:hypothetical protein
MPSMADMVVKKADNTTDVTFVALNPSSGDTVPAYWRQEAMGASAGLRATCQVRSQWNGNRSARRVEGTFQYPWTVTDTTTSVTSVAARVPISFVATIPVEIPDTVINEACAQFGNILDHTLMQSVLRAGFAPT